MFFFYFNRQESAPAHRIDPQGIIKSLMPCAPPDKSGFLADDENSLLVQCLHWNTARSRLEPVPLYHGPSRMAAASWARLDNRDYLGKKLEIDPAELTGYCDTELILFSYLKWGEACVDHLIGDFVFVIHDRQKREIFCGRDHMGARPFYYFVSGDVFVCATTLAAFLRLECVPVRIEEQWVAEYLLRLSMSFDRTPYVGIKKLPPAHCLTVTPTRTQLRQYFQLSAEPELKLKDSREYVDAYRAQLEEAIRCRLDSDYPIGSELSGGLDSSTVTAFAAKLMAEPQTRLHTFGFAFSELEPQYILAVSRACRLANNHIFTGNATEPMELMQRSLDLLGYPVEHPNATSYEPFYRMAEKLGIRTLLSGFGGDEFGATTHGYLVTMELLMRRSFLKLFYILPGNPLLRFLRLIRMELRRYKSCNFTVPAHNSRLYEAFKLRWPHRIVREELVRRYNLEERYFDTARFDAGYTDLKRFTLENSWQPFVPIRMENCVLMAAGRGIEYRWPLLDVRLVRLFLSIPSGENYHHGIGRYLHRRAVDEVLPKTVSWKESKNMGAQMDFYSSTADHSRQSPVSGLHPELAAYIDMDKLKRSCEDGIHHSASGMKDSGIIQQTRNIMVATSVSAWMDHVECTGGNVGLTAENWSVIDE
jgi:asparagine synthase (glutamine-hydrolysing)